MTFGRPRAGHRITSGSFVRVVVVAPVEYARAPTAVTHMGANAVVCFVHLKSADRADIAQSSFVDVCGRRARRRDGRSRASARRGCVFLYIYT